MAAKPPSNGYNGEGHHHAHGRTDKHSTTPGGDAGVVGTPSNQWWQQTPRRRAGALASQAATDRAARGRTHLGRQTEATSTKRGEIARSPWSEERAGGGGANAPHGGGGARRNRAARSSAIRNRQRGEGIRVSEWPSEGAAGWAGLVRSSPLGLTWPVGPGCQLPIFVLIKF
jgi:hypothetical protein